MVRKLAGSETRQHGQLLLFLFVIAEDDLLSLLQLFETAV